MILLSQNVKRFKHISPKILTKFQILRLDIKILKISLCRGDLNKAYIDK